MHINARSKVFSRYRRNRLSQKVDAAIRRGAKHITVNERRRVFNASPFAQRSATEAVASAATIYDLRVAVHFQVQRTLACAAAIALSIGGRQTNLVRNLCECIRTLFKPTLLLIRYQCIMSESNDAAAKYRIPLIHQTDAYSCS